MDVRSRLKVAVCQMTSVDQIEVNRDSILSRLEHLETEPPDLVCFPENVLYMRVREGDRIPGIDLSHPVLREIASWAKANGSAVHLGSVPIARDGQLYNSSVFVEPDGSIRDSYQKIHLFDVDVEGHKPVRESDAFAHGDDVSVLNLKGWRIGSSICYDLRFSELYSRYAKLEVDVILVPSAFLVPTGKAHWHVLTRARAIETQAYVLAAAQGGVHQGVGGGSRATYGHSLIVDPWGVVLEESPESETDSVLMATLDRDRIAKVRAQIPMKNHRRLV